MKFNVKHKRNRDRDLRRLERLAPQMTVGDFSTIQGCRIGRIESTRLYISDIRKFMNKRTHRRWRRRERKAAR